MDLYPVFEKEQVTNERPAGGTDSVKKTGGTSPRDAVVDPNAYRKEQNAGRERRERDEAGRHFESLKIAAEEANRHLEAARSPYRFYVCKEGDEVYITLARQDADGTVREVKRIDVTHAEFIEMIRQIEMTEGLLFSGTG